MKRLYRFLSVIILIIVCSCNKDVTEINFLNLKDSQGDSVSRLEFLSKGETQSIEINAGGNWLVAVEGSAEWYRVSPIFGRKGTTKVDITVIANTTNKERSTNIEFKSVKDNLGASLELYQGVKSLEPDPNPNPNPDPDPDPNPNPEPKPTEVVADLLDVVFQGDGTAYDISPSAMEITCINGPMLVNYYNELLGRYVAHFNHTPGASASNGYYKINYSSRPEFLQKLKDGHSLEVFFSTQQKLTGECEVKMFSGHEGGGTGFLMSTSSWGNCLTFLPNVSSNASSHWCWAKSGVNPEPGRFYHAVGVWDKTEGKAYIYVDGELKGSTSAVGSLKFPTNSAAHWLGIGADASPYGGQSAWSGDVAIARVYDQVLTAEQVAELYDKVKVDQNSIEIISLSDIEYLTSCTVLPGYKIHIYANGFKVGDKLLFSSVDESISDIELLCTTSNQEAIVEVPANMVSGKYNMILKRGTASFPVGSVDIIIGSSSEKLGKTKCVAHRCYHKKDNSGILYPENSLAAFKRSETLGVWGAEIDVWITKDDVVVVNHNSKVPTDSKNRVIEDYTYAELSDIKLANGEGLPKLEDFLQAMTGDVKNLQLVLEIKSSHMRTVTKCAELIKKYNLEKRVTWIAFSYDVCKKAHELMPNNMIMYLGGNKKPSECKADGIMGIDYSYNALTDKMIKEAHELGMEVNVWTVNGSMDMMHYIGKGVDYITTDNPDVLQSILSKQFITEN